ncbi:hypothetical protein DIPPA_20663, partial [Diplonema papillatum]
MALHELRADLEGVKAELKEVKAEKSRLGAETEGGHREAARLEADVEKWRRLQKEAAKRTDDLACELSGVKTALKLAEARLEQTADLSTQTRDEAERRFQDAHAEATQLESDLRDSRQALLLANNELLTAKDELARAVTKADHLQNQVTTALEDKARVAQAHAAEVPKLEAQLAAAQAGEARQANKAAHLQAARDAVQRDLDRAVGECEKLQAEVAARSELDAEKHKAARTAIEEELSQVQESLFVALDDLKRKDTDLTESKLARKSLEGKVETERTLCSELQEEVKRLRAKAERDKQVLERKASALESELQGTRLELSAEFDKAAGHQRERSGLLERLRDFESEAETNASALQEKSLECDLLSQTVESLRSHREYGKQPDDADEVIARLAAAELKKSELASALTTAKQKAATHMAKLQEARDELAQVTQERDRLASLNKALSDKQAREAGTKEAEVAAAHDALEEKVEELSGLSSTLQQAQLAHRQSEMNLSVLAHELEEANASLAELNEALGQLRIKHKTTVAELKQAQAQLQEEQTANTDLREALHQLQLKNKSSVSKLAAKEKSLIEASETIEDLTDSLNQTRSKYKVTGAELASKDDSLREKEDALDESCARIEELTKAAANAKQKAKGSAAALAEKEELANQLQQKERALNHRVTSLKAELANAQAEADALRASNEGLADELQQTLKAAESSHVHSISSLSTHQTEEQTRLQRAFEAHQKTKDQLSAAQSELQALRKRHTAELQRVRDEVFQLNESKMQMQREMADKLLEARNEVEDSRRHAQQSETALPGDLVGRHSRVTAKARTVAETLSMRSQSIVELTWQRDEQTQQLEAAEAALKKAQEAVEESTTLSKCSRSEANMARLRKELREEQQRKVMEAEEALKAEIRTLREEQEQALLEAEETVRLAHADVAETKTELAARMEAKRDLRLTGTRASILLGFCAFDGEDAAEPAAK